MSIQRSLNSSDVSISARAKGFTLVELMVVIAIGGVLTALAFPAFREMIANQRVRAAISDLAGDLSLMRAKAVEQHARVGIAPATAAGWESGWFVWVDSDGNGVQNGVEPIISRHGALNPNLVINVTGGIGFAPAGAVSLTVGSEGRFRTYDPGGLMAIGAQGFWVTTPNAKPTTTIMPFAGGAVIGAGKFLLIGATGRLSVVD